MTRASSYGLAALTHLAREKPTGPVASHDMAAAANGIPERFLLKVLLPLVSVGILRSIKGPNGGYTLARPAKDVSLLEVIEAVDGPMRGDAPIIGTDKADAFDKRLGTICDQATALVRERLAQVTLAELARTKGK
jgi:Rrf2 family protein